MNSQEIIALLQARIPLHTDSFSDTQGALLTSVGNTVTAVSVAHGLSVGEACVISKAQSDVGIESFTRNGILGTIITSTDHDVTNGLGTVEAAGATESAFNGTFTIHDTPNRRTIKVVMADVGELAATGSPVLVDGESVFRGYNGPQSVSAVLDPDTFQYEIVGSDLLPASGSPLLNRGLRISGSSTLDRIIDAYTKQPRAKNWMYVVLGDVVASKSRQVQNDAQDVLGRGAQGEGFQQIIIQSVTVYTFLPTADELAGRLARDESEVIFRHICGSILFSEPSSGVACKTQTALTFVNHGIQGFNAAFYVHQYTFEQVADLTFADTIGYSDDVAFRDLSISLGLSTGTETLISNINLDDEALP